MLGPKASSPRSKPLPKTQPTRPRYTLQIPPSKTIRNWNARGSATCKARGTHQTEWLPFVRCRIWTDLGLHFLYLVFLRVLIMEFVLVAGE